MTSFYTVTVSGPQYHQLVFSFINIIVVIIINNHGW